MLKLGDIIEFGGIIGGVSLASINSILSVVCFLISIVVGIINLVYRFKKVMEDGKISEEEKEELINEICKLQDEIKQYVGENENGDNKSK